MSKSSNIPLFCASLDSYDSANRNAVSGGYLFNKNKYPPVIKRLKRNMKKFTLLSFLAAAVAANVDCTPHSVLVSSAITMKILSSSLTFVDYLLQSFML